MPCCVKKQTNRLAIEFLTLCYEGGTEIELNDLYRRALDQGKTSQIFEARDAKKNQPFQKAAKHGSHEALSWIFKKWKENKKQINVDALDSAGYSALIHCCIRGYSSESKQDQTKFDRLKCVQILLSEKADVNRESKLVKMTALHWAAYNNDATVVRLLLSNNAKLKINSDGNTPVDIAGFCEKWDVVRVFCDEFNIRVTTSASQIQSRVNIKDNSIAPFNKNTATELSMIEKGPLKGQAKIWTEDVQGKHVFEVEEQDKVFDARIVYWAAYDGNLQTIQNAIQIRKISPFLKCFQNRSIVTAAVLGKKFEVFQYLLSFKYRTKAITDIGILQKSLLDTDDQGNTILHYAYSLNQPKMRDMLREYEPEMKKKANFKKNKAGNLPQELSHNLKVEDSDVERPQINNTALDIARYKSLGNVPQAQKDRLYQSPDYALVVLKNSIEIVKFELNFLVQKGGVYYEIFERTDQDTLLVVVFFDDSLIDTTAEAMKLNGRLKEFDCLATFKAYARDHFHSFNGQNLSRITKHIVDEDIGMGALMHTGVVIDHLRLHDRRKQQKIVDSFRQNWCNLLFAQITDQRWMNSVKPLDLIADYYGEKVGFYFAFYLHYTCWLLIPCFAGLIIYLIEIGMWQQNNKQLPYARGMDSWLNCLYSIIVALWTTIFVESWKRKQAYLANRWLVRDYKEVSFDRSQFKASFTVDYELRHSTKVAKGNSCLTYFFSIFVSLVSMVIVVAIYVGIQYWQQVYIKLQPENDYTLFVDDYNEIANMTINLNGPIDWNNLQNTTIDWQAFGKAETYTVYLSLAPSIVLAVIIAAAGFIFNKIAVKLVNMENHRDQESYDNSIIQMTFRFIFWNDYISYFILAFWQRNISKLAQSVVTLMVYKQMGKNIWEYCQYRGMTGFRKWKQTRAFTTLIKAEKDPYLVRELNLRKNVEEQIKMKKQTVPLLYYYQGAIIQFGFVAMFANTFPLAPFFSLIANLLEIKVQTNSFFYYSRRGEAQSAKGIGAWLPIMETLAYLCIPINCAILYFTYDLKKYFVFSDPKEQAKWTTENIVLLTFLIEHILIAIKVLVGQIDHTPKAVQDAERKRFFIENKAQEYLISKKGNAKTYEELLKEAESQDTAAKLAFERSLANGISPPEQKVVGTNNAKSLFIKLLKHIDHENLQSIAGRKSSQVEIEIGSSQNSEIPVVVKYEANSLW